MIRAAISQEAGDFSQALRLYERVLESDQRLFVEVLPQLAACYSAAGRQNELREYFESLSHASGDAPKNLAYAIIINGMTEPEILQGFVEKFILGHEIMASFVDTKYLESLSDGDRRQALQRIVGGLRQLALSGARYRCTGCGYSTQRLVWHCPSCKAWETIKPIQAFQFERLVT